MADLPQQRSAQQVFTNGSLDCPIEFPQETTDVDMEAPHPQLDSTKMPPMQQAQQSREIRLALEKLEHKISADAHATRRSELRAKQRLVDSLSQPPPPAGQHFASRSAAATAASIQEHIPRPIILNEILRGLGRASSPGTRSATDRPASPPNRSLSPRALHFTGTMSTPARAGIAGGTAAAAGLSASIVQRPTHHADPPQVSHRSNSSTLKGSPSPDPLARLQGGKPASPGPKVAATKAAQGRARPTQGSRWSAEGASLNGDVPLEQARRPMSPSLVQHVQALSQSRRHQLLQHRQEQQQQQQQQQNQRQRPASVEPLSIHRPQSVGRRYMSPRPAAAGAAGSSGGSGTARDATWATKARASSSGGEGARMESAGSRGATRGASSGFPRWASGSNFSSFDNILRGVESNIGGTFSATSSTPAWKTQLPSSRGGSGGSGGDASGGVSRGRYYERRVGGSYGGGGGGEGSTRWMGHGGNSSSYRGARPQSVGSLNPEVHVGLPSLSPTVTAAPRQAALGVAAIAAPAAFVARPRSAPRSISMPLPQPAPRIAPMSASAAGAPATAVTAGSTWWTSRPSSHPISLRTPGLPSAGLLQPVGTNGGLSRAPPSPSLLPMPMPISRVRSTSAVSVPAAYRPVRPSSVHPRNLQQQAQLPQVESVITESLLNHAAAAQRLQTQLLEDAIADGAGDSTAPVVSAPWDPATCSERMVNSDTEGEIMLNESGSLGLADNTEMTRRWQSPSSQHPEAGSSVRMVESLLRSNVAETASNQTRTLTGTSLPAAAVTARGLPLESPLTVLFSPRVLAPGGSAAPSSPFLASPMQPLRVASVPRANMLHNFIVPSGPLWPSAEGISGRGSSPGLTPDLLLPRQATRSQPTSPRPLSQDGQRSVLARRGDGGGVENAGGSPLRPQGLSVASSSWGSPAAVATASSPERAAKGLQALLSFLQQKFELRRERRQAARALEGWRRAAVSSGGGGSGGDSGVRSPRQLDKGAADMMNPASTHLGRYGSPGMRSGNPVDSGMGPPTRGRDKTSSGGGSGNGPHSSISRTSQTPITSGGGAFSPGPTSSSIAQAPRSGPQRPNSLSRSAGGATSSSSTPVGPIQVPDLYRQPRALREHADGVEGERERQQHERIKQLERELEQARKQQEQLLRQQHQEKHHHQLHQLQQQLQQLQEQLLQHHRQQQEQLDQLQHRKQQPVRPLSSEALLRRASAGGSKASDGALKTIAAPEMGTGVPPRPTSARRARESSMTMPQPPISVPSSPTAPAHGSTVVHSTKLAVPTSPSLATRLATYPTSHAVAAMPLASAVPLAVASPANSKASFRDLHQMLIKQPPTANLQVSEMERLLTAMNDDVSGAVAAATGGSSSGGGGIGAKAGAPGQTFNGVARPTAATPPSHLRAQSRFSPPLSPDLRSPARVHGGGGISIDAALAINGAMLQQRHPVAAVAPGSRAGGARGSLAAAFGTAAAAPGAIPGGSSGGSTDGSGNAVAGSSRIGGLTIHGAISSGAATSTSTGVATNSYKASSSGGGASGVSQAGEIEGGRSTSGEGATAGKLALHVKKKSKETMLNQKLEHVRSQLQGSDDREAAARAVVLGTPSPSTVTATAAAALLASANHAHANSSFATDAMSEQLEEMRASIHRIEQEMWGAAVATKSLARGVAAAAVAVNAKPVGSPVVRHHPHVVRQQAQPARPYETSPVARGGHLSLGGAHGPNGGPPDGRIVASAGGLDSRTASRGAVRQLATGAAGVLATAVRFDPQAGAMAGSPAGSMHTSFSLRGAFLSRDKASSTAGVGTARGEVSVMTKLATRSASTAGVFPGSKTGKVSSHGAPTAANDGTDLRIPATANAATAKTANARAMPSSLGGGGVRQVAGPRSSSPSSPAVTRHVDALEAQLLEELGELEDALQKLKHNTGKAMAWSGPGAVGA
ncbi:hypothetical protein VaNZ11_005465 [Volvox africanus]|uniref:Uncharacterized protein n=1 Tax=Volvox africanus TaxID=51714 RepID=A0ABQ5RZY9_9CHLO|nr:hypothetical protein VaNZ11_005465 [Volvox africanus]